VTGPLLAVAGVLDGGLELGVGSACSAPAAAAMMTTKKEEMFRRPVDLPMIRVVSLGCFLRFVILIRPGTVSFSFFMAGLAHAALKVLRIGLNLSEAL